MLRESRGWRRIFSEALAVNIILSIGLGAILTMAPPDIPKATPVEVTIDAGNKGGHGGGAPRQTTAIQTPQTTATLQSSEDTAVNNEVVPTTTETPTSAMPSAANQSSRELIAGSNGVGNGEGSGEGNGNGYGEGSGEGEGTGYGDGSGEGEGNGSGEDSDLVVLQAVSPTYPKSLRRRGVEGSVVCRITVESDGTVSSVEVVESSGYSAFDEAAVSAMYSWQFKPAKRNGTAVRSTARQVYHFQLEG